MKEYAAHYARCGKRPGRVEAEAIVARLMREAYVSPWPPPEVLDFFAKELISMLKAAADSDTPVTR